MVSCRNEQLGIYHIIPFRHFTIFLNGQPSVLIKSKIYWKSNLHEQCLFWAMKNYVGKFTYKFTKIHWLLTFFIVTFMWYIIFCFIINLNSQKTRHTVSFILITKHQCGDWTCLNIHFNYWLPSLLS